MRITHETSDIWFTCVVRAYDVFFRAQFIETFSIKHVYSVVSVWFQGFNIILHLCCSFFPFYPFPINPFPLNHFPLNPFSPNQFPVNLFPLNHFPLNPFSPESLFSQPLFPQSLSPEPLSHQPFPPKYLSL